MEALNRIDREVGELKVIQADHATRLRDLEKMYTKMAIAMAVLATGGSMLGNVIIKVLGG